MSATKMKSEERIIKSSFLAGATDIAIGLLLKLVGLSEWYWNTFHMFGVLGLGMIAYAVYHAYFYRRER